MTLFCIKNPTELCISMYTCADGQQKIWKHVSLSTRKAASGKGRVAAEMRGIHAVRMLTTRTVSCVTSVIKTKGDTKLKTASQPGRVPTGPVSGLLGCSSACQPLHSPLQSHWLNPGSLYWQARPANEKERSGVLLNTQAVLLQRGPLCKTTKYNI